MQLFNLFAYFAVQKILGRGFGLKERANPNYCQQEVLSRKNGASRKHHKIRQLQQIITAVRHQGKTKTLNISLFFWAAVAKALARQGWVFLRISKTDFRFFPALQIERQNPRRILSHTPCQQDASFHFGKRQE
jgi:hypothetical protein